ncbi:MAG: hypothetical protein C5B49_01940 [Bdellovibrio sp.]|nr:MAG: hypothetical protein C5B49_01940 [Bdellovibrio sp.]
MPDYRLSETEMRERVKELKDEIIRSLEFVTRVLEKDREKLDDYFRRFGDLNYRPILSKGVDGEPIYGDSTFAVMEPLASKWRTTVKSLLESVMAMEEVLTAARASEDEESAPSRGEKKNSLREMFSAVKPAAPEVPEEEQSDSDEAPKAPHGSKLAEAKAAAERIAQAKLESKPIVNEVSQASELWADPIPTAQAFTPAPAKPAKADPAVVGLSPALRAKLAASGGLAGLKAKYSSESED